MEGTYAQLAQRRFCSRACGSPAIAREAGARNYTTRAYVDRDGYRILSVRTPEGRRTVREHRWVMEQHLGRRLERTEIVHHINHDRLDNRLENLELIASQSEHIKGEHPAGQQWSRKYDCCIDCGSDERPHRGFGRCANCYEKNRTAQLRSARSA